VRLGRCLIVGLGIVLVALALAVAGAVYVVTVMPGHSFRGPLPALAPEESTLRDELRRDIAELAADSQGRNIHNAKRLDAAGEFIAQELTAAGYSVEQQRFVAHGATCFNVIAELPGTSRAGEILVVGAHYDSVPGCPGANDNGSGVAALLAIARRCASQPGARTLRFVAFVNEEILHGPADCVGSMVYARRCRERGENVVGVISLETIGYYSDQPGSQRYPWPFSLLYPAQGDFIGFVGNLDSRAFVRDAAAAFRRNTQFPSEGAAMPSFVPDAGRSDQLAFWQQGYPGLMVTDTAPFRYPYYHTPQDTPDKLDYERMARVAAGLERTIRALALSETPAR